MNRLLGETHTNDLFLKFKSLKSRNAYKQKKRFSLRGKPCNELNEKSRLLNYLFATMLYVFTALERFFFPKLLVLLSRQKKTKVFSFVRILSRIWFPIWPERVFERIIDIKKIDSNLWSNLFFFLNRSVRISNLEWD